MEGNRIKFLSREAQTEESAGRRKFSLAMEEKMKEYEKRMLCGSQCPYILPMCFITEDGSDIAFYDFTGKIQLTEYIGRPSPDALPAGETRKPVCRALDTLSGILGCVKGMEDYLIFPERIAVHTDAVFMDPDSGRAALAFYPEEKPETSFQSRILALMDELEAVCRDADTGQYFKKLKDFIQSKNPGLDGMIAMLGTMQREAGYIYWDSRSFRKADETEPDADHGGACGLPDRRDSRCDGRGHSLKPKKGTENKLRAVKLAGIQALFLSSLAAAFLSGAFDAAGLAGLTAIAAAADFWLVRKLRQAWSCGSSI
jgi:hypothetical protein